VLGSRRAGDDARAAAQPAGHSRSVVDRTRYEDKVASLEPWLARASAYAQFPEPLDHRRMQNASKALDCISCMCCYSACPVIGLET
jgi:Succinate dehydrogenase/fumarate reductase, Fe-S protein subunit